MSARDDREVPGAISDFMSSLTTSLEFFTDCRVELEITRLESINDFSIAPPRNEEEKGRPTSQLVALTAYDAIAEHPVALLGLDLNFRGFISDRHGDLTISQSTIAVWPLAKRRGTQLFRYDYLRKPGREIPAAHLQVAAHRDQFTHLLGFRDEEPIDPGDAPNETFPPKSPRSPNIISRSEALAFAPASKTSSSRCAPNSVWRSTQTSEKPHLEKLVTSGTASS